MMADRRTDDWHPVALSAAIAPGTSAGATLDGLEIAVWRDIHGVVHAWEDRCPHRGMKLSFGFVRDDHIACLYHGWEYDAAGQCRKIPAHPTLVVPASICVKTYAVADAAGMVWVAPTGDGQGPNDGAATPIRSLYLDCGRAGVVAALSDPANVFGNAARIDGVTALIATDAGALVIGIQSIAADRTALHITLQGIAPPEALVQVAHLAEGFRRDVEGGHR